MKNTPALQELLSDLIDEIALEKPLDWESCNYEELKNLSISNAIEMVAGFGIKFEGMPSISLLATIAYMLMENTQLWIDNYGLKQSMAGK
jgi:hypothetical protein